MAILSYLNLAVLCVSCVRRCHLRCMAGRSGRRRGRAVAVSKGRILGVHDFHYILLGSIGAGNRSTTSGMRLRLDAGACPRAKHHPGVWALVVCHIVPLFTQDRPRSGCGWIDGENPYLFKGACSSYISAAAANTGERARYAG